MRRRLLMVLALITASSPAALAQPGVFGGCPQGPLRDVQDGAAIIEDVQVTVDAAGTVHRAPMLYRCTPRPVRGGKVRGEPRCTVDGEAVPAVALTRAPELRAKVKRDDDRRWRRVVFYAGRRQLAIWHAPEIVVCVGGLFLSPDRRTIVAEITLDKRPFLSEEEAKRVMVMQLPRPLPKP